MSSRAAGAATLFMSRMLPMAAGSQSGWFNMTVVTVGKVEKQMVAASSRSWAMATAGSKWVSVT